MPQNPTRQVRALLDAVELENSLSVKRLHCYLMSIFTHNFDFGYNKKKL